MSGKKPSPSAISWITCQSCKTRYPNRPLLQRHSDLGCSQVVPCIESNGNVIIQISLLQGGIETSKENSLSNAQHILYINYNFINEMNLKTLDWVLVEKRMTQEEDKQPSTPPLAMQIWAIQVASPIKAYLNSQGQLTHPTLNSEKDNYIVRPAGEISLVKSVTFHISPVPRQFDDEELKGEFEDWFQNKPIFVGNVFLVPFLTYMIEVRVETLVLVNEVLKIGRMTDETDIQLSYALNKKLKRGTVDPKITLGMIGGLDSQVMELVNTIRHSMQPKDNRNQNNGKGILIFGQHGTGKTMLINGVCTTLGLSKIVMDTSTTGKQKSLQEIFEVAKQSKEDTAIVIENMDLLCSSRREWTESLSFSADLRNGMDRLEGGVVVIATAINPDAIDPSLRLPHVFGREIEILVPSEPDRFQILKNILTSYDCELTEDQTQELAQSTHGFVGADLEALRASALRLGNDNPTFVNFKEALKFTTPSAMKSIQLEIPHVRWEDIGGLKELKFNLRQSIEWPRLHPEAFRRMGLTPPKGILMYGPPGCSKTMIAKALATESGLNFLSVKGSDLFSKWVGESEKSVQNLFRKARQVAPAILFFDELDALGSERGQLSGGSNVHERVLAQLLVEIDGIEPLNDVTIVAATNRPDLIDMALTRPGRLDRIIYVPLPDAETRREIFKIKTKKMPLCSDVDLNTLVSRTEGYSGAEITGICQEAGLEALEEDFGTLEVRMEHFIGALEKCPKRISEESLLFYAAYSKTKSSD